MQERFLKGSFLASKMDSFFGDGVGGLLCTPITAKDSIIRQPYQNSSSSKYDRVGYSVCKAPRPYCVITRLARNLHSKKTWNEITHDENFG